MDFWDLTKVLLRRWYFAAPLLLLTVFGAYRTSTTVKPDYVATAYVQVVPPTAPEEPVTTPRKKPSGPLNPWLQLGYNALGQAAVLSVQDTAVLEQLKAQGLSDSVVITLNDHSPVITVEVVGVSKEEAGATSEEVVKRLAASVQELQAEYGAKKDSYATTRRLDRGNNIEEANSKVKRALVAVGGAGLLFSVALTIGLDALLRRRSRRLADAAVDDEPEPQSTTGQAAGQRAAQADPGTVRLTTPDRSPSAPKAGGRYFSSALGDAEKDGATRTDAGEKTTVLRLPGEATIVLPTPGRTTGEERANGHNGKGASS